MEMADRTVRFDLPPQVVPGILADTIEAAGQTLEAGSKSILGSNIATNLFLAGSLNYLWGMINNL